MEAKLIVVSPPDQTAEYTLELPAVVGRGRDATLKLLHPQVSRRHCEIRQSDEGLVVRDLGSLNGTYVGENRIEGESRLRSGELLTVGSLTFRAIYEEQGGWLPEGVESLVGGTAAGAVASGSLAPDAMELDALEPVDESPAAMELDELESVDESPGAMEGQAAENDRGAVEEPPMHWLQDEPAMAEPSAADETFRSPVEETVRWNDVQPPSAEDAPLELSLDEVGKPEGGDSFWSEATDSGVAAPAEAELAPLELTDEDDAELPLAPAAAAEVDDEPMTLDFAEDDELELSPEDDLQMSSEPAAAEPAVGLDFPQPTDEFAAKSNQPPTSDDASGSDTGDWSFLDEETPVAEADSETPKPEDSKDDDEELKNFFKSLE